MKTIYIHSKKWLALGLTNLFLLLFLNIAQAQDYSYIVGCGYDVTMQYADRADIKESLFDVREEGGDLYLHANGNKHAVELRPTPATSYVEIYGRSLQEYFKSFANKTSVSASYGLFSASVSVAFKLDQSGSSLNEFMTIQHYVDTKLIKLPYDLNDKVKPSVRQQLDNPAVSPEDIFRRYGTHYIWEAPIGGRVDFNFQFDKSTSSQQFDLEVTARAEYNSFIGGSASVENQTNFTNKLNEMSSRGYYTIRTYGGAADGATLIRQDRQKGMNKWAESVASNPTLSRFTKSSLRPVWDLCTNESRKQQLKNAFDEYVKGNSILNQPPKLDVRKVRNFQFILDDAGSGADHSFAAFKPVANNGYYIVGHHAEKTRNPQGSSILVKDVSGSKNSLAKPIDFRRIWGDWGSGGNTNWTIWCPICPPGFVPLGHVVAPMYDLPSGPMVQMSGHPFDDVRCVNERLTLPAYTTKDDWIYGDWGSGADQDLKVYKIKGATGSYFDAELFYAQQNYSDPLPNPALRVLMNPAEAPEQRRVESARTARSEMRIAPLVLANNNITSTNNGEAPLPNVQYNIESKAYPGNVLDVWAASNDNGALISLFGKHVGSNQKFTLESTSDGYFMIKNVKSGKVFDSSSKLLQWEGSKAQHQQYKPIAAGNGYYYIEVRNAPGHCLQVEGIGEDIIAKGRNGSAQQLFKFITQ